MPTLLREDIAWAAGFFDGEGYIGLARNDQKIRGVVISVGQTDPRPLERLAEIFGVGKVCGPRQPNYPNAKPMWNWDIYNFEHCQYVVAAMWPWLSVKQEQIAKVLVDYRNRPIRQPKRRDPLRGCVRGHSIDRYESRPDASSACLDCGKENARRYRIEE